MRRSHLSIRKAAVRYHVAKYALYDHLNLSVNVGRNGRPPALSADEEKILVDALLHYSDLAVSLIREHVQEALQMFIRTIPEERRETFLSGIKSQEVDT